jgi:AcrR family transcriptional regulator
LAKLKLALAEVLQYERRVTISAVARKAGITPGLIHNTYPDFAELIRSHSGKATRKRCADKANEVTDLQAKLKQARADLRLAIEDIQKLASLNETLRIELAAIRVSDQQNVVEFPQKRC